MRALYPGSFDPPTNGHLDIITRLAETFDEVVVAVGHNPDKRGWLPVEKRVELLERSATTASRLPNVSVTTFSGLAVECAKTVGADLIVKGVRGEVDLPSEMSQAVINRDLTQIETLLISSDPRWAQISSSWVRQLVAFGAPIEDYVPAVVADAIAEDQSLGG